MITDKFTYLLLHIIQKEGNAKRLIYEGCTYADIINKITELRTAQLITQEKENIFITEKGLELYEQLDKLYKEKNKKKWIQEDQKSKIPHLQINAVFIPLDPDLDLS